MATAASAAPIFSFDSVYEPDGNVRSLAGATIADNGAVAFYELLPAPNDTENARTWVAAPDGSLTLLGSNETGPLFGSEFASISDNGRWLVVRTSNKSLPTKPGIWRYDLLNPDVPVLIAAEGDPLTAGGPPSDLGPIGQPGCPCTVDNDGRVMFTVSGGSPSSQPGAAIHGDGGALTAFAFANREGFDRVVGIDQNNQGVRVAVVADDGGIVLEDYEFMRGLDESVDLILAPPDGLGGYDSVFLPVITDQTPLGTFNFGAMAERNGVTEIIARTQTESYGVQVDTGDVFHGFFGWSLNENDDLVFLADLDSAPQDIALYSGPDPVKDRIIGAGDVLFGKLIERVELSGVDGMNANGQVALTLHFSDGSEAVVRSQSLGEVLADIEAQIALPGGGSLLLETDIATPPPAPEGLGFSIDFLLGSTIFEVLLGGESLGRFGEADVTDGAFSLMGIDPTPFRSGDPVPFALRLIGDGGTDSAVRIGDLGFFLSGGEFSLFEDWETGYFDDWRISGDDASRVFLTAVPIAPIPIPAGGMLLLTALSLAVCRFHRAGHFRS